MGALFSLCFPPSTPQPDHLPDHEPEIQPFEPNDDESLIIFPYAEVVRATNNFKSNKVSEDALGSLYHATIRGKTYAMKKMTLSTTQGQKQWTNEIIILGQLKHPNLLRLHGYCTNDSDGILFFDLVTTGNLDDHLNGNNSSMDWNRRIRIAYEIALAIKYLHDSSVIHRDLKATSILIDQNGEVKVADFGLAKAIDQEMSVITTAAGSGANGYCDPQFLEKGRISKASDVYSFGVLLLQLLTGKPAASADQRTPLLADWALEKLDKKKVDYVSLVDLRISNQIIGQEIKLKRLFTIAKHCINREDRARPLMADVIPVLEGLL